MEYKIKESQNLDDSFLNDVLELDRLVYPENLQGSIEALKNRFLANKEMYLLLYKEDLLIGYICFFPITQKLSNSIYTENKLYRENITSSDICAYSKEVANDIYLLSVAINPNNRDSEAIRVLTNSFYVYLDKKKKQGYLLRDILSTSVSKDGENFLANLNFKKAKEITPEYQLFTCHANELRTIHFRKSYKDDLYILIPFVGDVAPQGIDSANDEIASTFIEAMNEFAELECYNLVSEHFNRQFLGTVPLGCIDDYDTLEVLETSDAYLFLTTHPTTHLHLLTILLPNNKLSTTMIQDQASSNNLFIYEDGKLVNIIEYMKNKYDLQKIGEPKSIINLSNKPENVRELKSMLAAEAYDGEYNLQFDGYYVSSHEIEESLDKNISQYEFNKKYASDVAVVNIFESFSDDFKTNVIYEDGIFITVENIMFQHASIDRANKKIVSELSKDGDVSLKFIEDLYAEFGKTAPFWNIENFNYVTNQNTAFALNKSFKTQEKYNIYQRNQNFLEHIVDLKNAQSSNRENKMLNFIVIILTLLQVIPTLITFFKWLVSGESITKLINLMGVSFSALLLIVIIVLLKKKIRKTKDMKPSL